jgi:hypothetical protein
MGNLKQFSDAGTPLLEELGVAAPSLTNATKTLTPFSEATTVALKSLGKAGEESGPVFTEAKPVVRKASKLAISGEVPTTELARLFVSLKKTGGWEGLTSLIYNTAASLNGFDKYGHFGRTLVTLSTCLEYKANEAGYSGCAARFNGTYSSSEGANTSPRALVQLINEMEGKGVDGAGKNASTPELGSAESTEGKSPAERRQSASEPGLGEATSTEAGTEPLLNYLMGQEEE